MSTSHSELPCIYQKYFLNLHKLIFKPMRPVIKIKISRVFIFILLVGFIFLPLQVSFCFVAHEMAEHNNHETSSPTAKGSYIFNQQYSKSIEKCCEDSGILYFNSEGQRQVKNQLLNFILATHTLTVYNNLQYEKKFSLKFVTYHFSPPQDTSNKLYKIISILLI